MTEVQCLSAELKEINEAIVAFYKRDPECPASIIIKDYVTDLVVSESIE